MAEHDLPQPKGVPGWTPPNAPREMSAPAGGTIADPAAYRAKRRYDLMERVLDAPTAAAAVLCALWLVLVTAVTIVCVLKGVPPGMTLGYCSLPVLPALLFLAAVWMTRDRRHNAERQRGTGGDPQPGVKDGDL